MKIFHMSGLRIFSFPLFLAILFTASSCDESNSPSSSSSSLKPLSPQELGYTKTFEEIWISTARHTNSLIGEIVLLEQNEEIGQLEEAEENKENIRDSFTELQEISQSELENLKPVIPPSSMENFHSEWLDFLETIKVVKDLDELSVAGRDFLSSHSELKRFLNGKSRKYLKKDGVVVEFQPVGVPVKGSFDLSSHTFGLKFTTGSTVTPVGAINLAIPVEAEHVSDLVIFYQNRVQYVTLAPGFEVSVDAVTCHQTIKQNGDALILRLKSCSSSPNSTLSTTRNSSSAPTLAPTSVSPSKVDSFTSPTIVEPITAPSASPSPAPSTTLGAIKKKRGGAISH